MLKETFITLLKRYSIETQLISNLWKEVDMNYSDGNRHYHTLEHLENLWEQLNEVKNLINDWDTILFTLYYHDIIYNPLRNDNEEKSAELMEDRLTAMGLPKIMVDKCKAQIMATQKHLARPDSDTFLF
jgi:predicted metal-dependent HD superfamily phosphohydrolase